jgi:hypothetical protein
MPLSVAQKKSLLVDTIQLLKTHGYFQDVCIYVGDRRYFSEKTPWYGEQKLDEELNLWYQDNINPKEYVEYANPETMTSTFEGLL